MQRNRNESGHFEPKSDDERKVRSIRVTDEVWEKFGELAAAREMTRADLLEDLIEADLELPEPVLDEETLEEVIEILQEALTLKANAGGAIKAEIKRALEMLPSL